MAARPPRQQAGQAVVDRGAAHGFLYRLQRLRRAGREGGEEVEDATLGDGGLEIEYSVLEPLERRLGGFHRFRQGAGDGAPQLGREFRQELVRENLAPLQHPAEFLRRDAHRPRRDLERPRQPLAELAPEFLRLHRALGHDLLQGPERAPGVVGRRSHDPGRLGDGGEDLPRRLAFQRGALCRRRESRMGVRRRLEVDAQALRLGAHEGDLPRRRLRAPRGLAEARLQTLHRHPGVHGRPRRRRQPERRHRARRGPRRHRHPVPRAGHALRLAGRVPGLVPGLAEAALQLADVAYRAIQVRAHANGEIEIAGHRLLLRYLSFGFAPNRRAMFSSRRTRSSSAWRQNSSIWRRVRRRQRSSKPRPCPARTRASRMRASGTGSPSRRPPPGRRGRGGRKKGRWRSTSRR